MSNHQTNYTKEEALLLLSLVEGYRGVIPAIRFHLKNEDWVKVTAIYNTHQDAITCKTTNELIQLWRTIVQR